MTEKTFDFVVAGATPGGIACALSAAREGLNVLLTHYHQHVGGLLTSGLGVLDTQYNGKRAPIHAEFCDRLLQAYRDRYGMDSPQYRSCFAKVFSRYDNDSSKTEQITNREAVGAVALPERYYGRLNLESHMAEQVFECMLSEEPNVTLWRNCTPALVEKEPPLIHAVHFKLSDGSTRRISAKNFADCTYEGDLMALAGVPYRVGREARSEFHEAHAGRIFTSLHFATAEEGGYPRDAVEGKINLEPYEAISQQFHAGSTGEGDCKVQAYTFRLTLCCNSGNRIPVERPASYNRDIYLRMRNRWGLGAPIANDKLRWNTSNLPGGSWDYPEADWPERKIILQRHLDHALGFLWFLQNDEAVPSALQEKARQYGLAKDEYTDNGHIPWEMYVREARRLVGRAVFTEQDATLGSGLERAPIHPDSIAITEWGMDSHSVSEEMMPGSRREGKFLLTEMSRPGQVPWRCLLPSELDNLIVPICLSASHVGWGAIRLEPTWMHIGESAGIAATHASEIKIPLAQLKVGSLQKKLVEKGIMISFFNDFDMETDAYWIAAVQYLGAKWFFASYDAAPDKPLDLTTAEIWSHITSDILTGKHKHLDDERWAERYPKPGTEPPVESETFRIMIEKALKQRDLPTEKLSRIWQTCVPEDGMWTRSQACLLFYQLLTEA